ncbi:hypothetical protein CONCODRAFT_10819 [Conidiobolus coronatus NRRL 28638]|uniref:Uncharacterized protein n=1 Tax=Conidiobolus coronatus (strain ATCC 28846 / CBS 209.66 / NRRL 28638) TaxID=796925 RepID=A0A137NWH8_CONC2|nr:hypothetical protein CONCODRAFT_10819 [Conidiobolus coronatus NRRL 28638]|eukprot:KXN67163.1 hypothetical protein CONCODRAFT_10819 [Conidiobolus coronatus NRRL 28638]
MTQKYLIEDKYIILAQANKIFKETGLGVDYNTMIYVLIILGKEMEIKEVKDRSKLKDFHLERLKKYLSESLIIKVLETQDKLYQYTYLGASRPNVYRVFTKLNRDNQVN